MGGPVNRGLTRSGASLTNDKQGVGAMRHALVKRARSRARRIDPRRVRIRIARIAASLGIARLAPSLAALAWTSVAPAQTLAALSPPNPQPAVASAPPAQTLAA